MFPYKRILVAVDGSPISDRAMDEAINLARQTGAELQLIHVVDELAYLTGFETATCYADDIVPLMRDEGQKLLDERRRKSEVQGVACETRLVMGGPGRICDHIADQVRRGQADLLVLGSHGRRGIKRWLLGSDAEQILRVAPVPVLLVRTTEEETPIAAPEQAVPVNAA